MGHRDYEKNLLDLLWNILSVGKIYSLPAFAQKIKIACIGNSITEGVGASSGSATYPSVLQRDLGTEKYEVSNFGASGVL